MSEPFRREHSRRHGLLAAALASLLLAPALRAQHAGVAQTLHNLSASGPGDLKAQDETEVCKFCHIPHNAVAPEPLWSHALSTAARYDTPRVQRAGVAELSPQPDGSSRLCLSCHDGTVALGDLGRSRLPMAGTDRLDRGRRSHLGTDLSGSHPISIAIPEAGMVRSDGRDMGLRPAAAIQGESGVRLDANGKLQCTTCHDPHSDRYYQPGSVPRFWVLPTVTEVCLKCHDVR